MFSAFQTFGKLGALASSVARAWSPLALWPDGIATPGMWISPRDLTSQWQDYTGTTPVTTPGTVADSSNPVGLALDIRAGNPPPLGPELVSNPGPFTDTSGFTGSNATLSVVSGRLRATATGTADVGMHCDFSGLTKGAGYFVEVEAYVGTEGSVVAIAGSGLEGESKSITSDGTLIAQVCSTILSGRLTIRGIAGSEPGKYIEVGSVSFKEVPGNHMLQSTSAARPLLSAYDGQTLGPGDTYDAAGYPVFQLCDGVDDGMATAAFAAGTLIDGMDCMIAVRRDSAASCVAGLYNGVADATKFFGMAESASGSGCVGSGAGTPTVWVDNTQLTGGTAVTRGTLHTALTVGDWHILEFRNLDLSTWTAAGFGLYTSYVFPGPRGDIMFYPSTASTTDKDAARQWLADYYGVTLP